MKIHIKILLKNRRIKKLKVNAEKPFFTYSKNIYILDAESIGLRSINGMLSPKPIALYFEGIPTAIRLEKQDQSESVKLLDNFILEMNIKKSSAIRTNPLAALIDKYLSSPEKMLGIVSVLITIAMLAYIFLGGSL